MTSSMFSGERRWASARRSGMTVLGKVAVPKPINLPSQKLENHGLDPNVEIVPKGTLSWGTQSPSVPKSWGPSAVSPNADGIAGSPSHRSGRPSSGSGTRPSTADSDRTQDPTSNAWGPSSRPSSASGSLTSDQTTLSSLRPHSAETRPGSSQLSRFAEPPLDNPVAWGPNNVSNKLGVTSANKDGFSLSTGDFPTLGSEKDYCEYGYNSRPGSSSSRATSGKEKNTTSSVGNVKSGIANTWARDGSHNAEHGVQTTLDKCRGDIPPCANPNCPPQHFDAWHGPPINHTPGVWYGGPRGVPYGAPLPRGGYPVEPFPFYRPQMAPNNSQPVPPVTGPRGHHPKNGDLCRPHVPNAYIHPHMPINPGFYPAPLTYDGYYGPPMGYVNSNERDMPIIGTPGGSPVYKKHPCENAGDHSRSPIHVSRGKPSVHDQMESRTGNFDDTQGPYKVLMKQSSDLAEKRAEEVWEHGVPSKVPHKENKDQPRALLQKNEWGLEDDEGNWPLDSAELPENWGKANRVVNCLGNKLEHELPSFPPPSELLSATPDDPTLMQKIDGLNAKDFLLDEQLVVATLPFKEEQTSLPHPSGTAPLRRPSRGAQGRLDLRGKRLNNQDADGWQKKPLPSESSIEVSVAKSETSSIVPVHDHHRTMEDLGKSELNLQSKDEGDFSTSMFDASDTLSQRAMMREIAKQRAEQLQKEEEERVREQKAKALAKLEELNRRTQVADISSQKVEKARYSGSAQQEEDESHKFIQSSTDYSKLDTSSAALVSNRKEQIRAGNSIMVGENTVIFEGSLLEKQDNVHLNSEVANFEAAPQLSEGSFSKLKRMDYKQRQSANSGRSVTEKSVPVTQPELPNTQVDLPHIKAANDAGLSENTAVEVGSGGKPGLQTNSNVMTEPSTHHKRKNNRSSENKHKIDDVAPVAAVPSTVSKENDVAKLPTEKLESDTNLSQSKAVVKNTIQVCEQHPYEETGGQRSHQWKPQQSGRMPRNQQANNRMGDKFPRSDAVTWAPVRSQIKNEVIDNPGDGAETGTGSTNAGVVQNNVRTKRAEMERYIPKPVAKELTQQGSTQQHSIVSQNIGCSQHGDSTIVDIGPAAVSKDGNSKLVKPPKARGLWRQRGSAEAVSTGRGLQKAWKDARELVEDQRENSDAFSLKEQSQSSTDLKTADGWSTNDCADTSASIPSAVMNGHGLPSGGKHLIKGHQNMGSNSDLDHGILTSLPTDEILLQSSAVPVVNEVDKHNALKENCHGGVQTSQWQPKSQIYSVHNSRNRHSEGQMDDDVKTHNGSGKNVLHSYTDQSLSKPMIVVGEQNVGHQDFKRERKAASFRGCPHSPNPTTEQDQHISSGFRKNGNNNKQFGRGHESRGDAPLNRERLRQGSHLEYQPIGQYGNDKPNTAEGSTEGSHNTGSKYRERTQGHSRRGGGKFYGRRSGTVHRDACND